MKIISMTAILLFAFSALPAEAASKKKPHDGGMTRAQALAACIKDNPKKYNHTVTREGSDAHWVCYYDDEGL